MTAEKQEAEFKKQAKTIHKLFVGTFETELGQKCLEHLVKTFIDRPIYKQGLSLEETAYRQGQADLIKQMQGALNGR